MDYSMLLTGITTGFVIAMAVGPIGILCIRQTLAHGLAAGLATGLGAAFADAAFGSIAAFGLTTISDFFNCTTILVWCYWRIIFMLLRY